MARVTIEFNTDNSAFEENPSETHFILADLDEALARSKPGDDGKVYDTNGNRIGQWKWEK